MITLADAAADDAPLILWSNDIMDNDGGCE